MRLPDADKLIFPVEVVTVPPVVRSPPSLEKLMLPVAKLMFATGRVRTVAALTLRLPPAAIVGVLRVTLPASAMLIPPVPTFSTNVVASVSKLPLVVPTPLPVALAVKVTVAPATSAVLSLTSSLILPAVDVTDTFPLVELMDVTLISSGAEIVMLPEPELIVLPEAIATLPTPSEGLPVNAASAVSVIVPVPPVERLALILMSLPASKRTLLLLVMDKVLLIEIS